MSGRIFRLILVVVLAAACTQSESQPLAPAITAQGFDIAEPRVAAPGEFEDVRVRLEVPGRIEAIRITDRSFATDLAKTLDKSLFGLFGLDQRPYSMADVTLNFRNYLNDRITTAGAYQIDIVVTDHHGQSAAASVLLDLPAATEEPTAAMIADAVEQAAETGDFHFERVGPGHVSGAEAFGITWKTIDPIYVTIRLAAATGGATKIARLDAAAFEGVRTQSQLAAIVDASTAAAAIDFDTAEGAAAGQVIAVVNDQRRFILRASASETQLSRPGTTVVLTGRYKF